MAEIPSPDLNKDKDDNNVVVNIEKRRISLFCKIDRNAALEMQQIIEEFKEQTDLHKPISVLINTDGGLAFQGLAIYDLMHNSGLGFRTIVIGEVASAGVAVVLAGQERWIYKHAAINFHATAMQFDKPTQILEQHEENVQRRQKKVINNYYNEIILANSKLTLKQLRKFDLEEACLTAEQALRFGLVHKIIG